MKLFSRAGMVCLLALSVRASAAIYGVDDRREIHQVSDAVQRARATAVMISPVYYEIQPDRRVKLNFDSLADTYGVCKSERFAHQPSSNISCTGFLIAPQVLVTAGHCMVNRGEAIDTVTAFCSDFSWLFDYQVKPDGTVQLSDIPADRLVGCKRVIYANLAYDYDPATGLAKHGQDFAVIELERPMNDRTPLTLSRKAVTLGEKISRIGYPSGLPAKVTADAQVTRVDDPEFFRSDIDALGGDSGGPVFNSSGEVIGIMVRAFPDEDYVESGSASRCSKPNHCDPVTGRCDSEARGYPVGSQVQTLGSLLRRI